MTMCDMAYMAKCSCGKMVMACMDNPAHKKDTANEVSKCIKAGYEISRITVEEVRAMPFCNNHGNCIKEPTQ